MKNSPSLFALMFMTVSNRYINKNPFRIWGTLGLELSDSYTALRLYFQIAPSLAESPRSRKPFFTRNTSRENGCLQLFESFQRLGTYSQDYDNPEHAALANHPQVRQTGTPLSTLTWCHCHRMPLDATRCHQATGKGLRPNRRRRKSLWAARPGPGSYVKSRPWDPKTWDWESITGDPMFAARFAVMLT